jgi:hypothetical protein
VTFASDTEGGVGDDSESARVAEEMEIALRSEVVLLPARGGGGADGEGGGEGGGKGGGEGGGEGGAGDGDDTEGRDAYSTAWQAVDGQRVRAADDDDVDEEEQQARTHASPHDAQHICKHSGATTLTLCAR